MLPTVESSATASVPTVESSATASVAAAESSTATSVPTVGGSADASATTTPANAEVADASTPSTTAGATATGAGANTTVEPQTAVGAAAPTQEQWEALRQCESQGNYRAVSISPAGRYRGAYQFSRSTWDWVARRSGADQLVGVDPAEASAADQDRMAQALWDINGWQPWPSCSRKLGYL